MWSRSVCLLTLAGVVVLAITISGYLHFKKSPNKNPTKKSKSKMGKNQNKKKNRSLFSTSLQYNESSEKKSTASSNVVDAQCEVKKSPKGNNMKDVPSSSIDPIHNQEKTNEQENKKRKGGKKNKKGERMSHVNSENEMLADDVPKGVSSNEEKADETPMELNTDTDSNTVEKEQLTRKNSHKTKQRDSDDKTQKENVSEKVSPLNEKKTLMDMDSKTNRKEPESKKEEQHTRKDSIKEMPKDFDNKHDTNTDQKQNVVPKEISKDTLSNKTYETLMNMDTDSKIVKTNSATHDYGKPELSKKDYYSKGRGYYYKYRPNRRPDNIGGEIWDFQEVKGDLFDAPNESALAHCVAEDFQMGAGIAVEFRRRFKSAGYLMDLGTKTGGVAVLQKDGRFIYYLVTKRLSKGKPTLQSLEKSLKAMAKHAAENEVKLISMPTIGSGLDRLDWDCVKDIIRDTFSRMKICITIYHWDKGGDKINSSTVKHAKYILAENGKDTALLYLASNDPKVITSEMRSIDARYPFLSRYKSGALGEIVKVVSSNVEYTYGLVCRNGENINYEMLDVCLGKLGKMLDGDKYTHIGIQACEYVNMNYVTTLLKFGLHNKFTVWICWPNEISEDFIEYRY